MLKGFRKYFWFGVLTTLVYVCCGFLLHAIWGMLLLIFFMLFGILEVLLEMKNER